MYNLLLSRCCNDFAPLNFRTIELSLLSSFQLSLTVLVRYLSIDGKVENENRTKHLCNHVEILIIFDCKMLSRTTWH